MDSLSDLLSAGAGLVSALRGKKKQVNVLETVKVSNSFPLPEQYLKSTKNVKTTRDLMNTLDKNIGSQFKKDASVIARDYKAFNNQFKISSNTIVSALEIIYKNMPILEALRPEYEKKATAAQLAADAVNDYKKELKGLSKSKEAEKGSFDALEREFKEQLAKSKDAVAKATAKAQEEVKTAERLAKIAVEDAQHEALATITKFQEDAQATLDAYAEKRKLKGEDLEKWKTGKYEWSTGGSTAAAVRGFFTEKGKDTGEKAKQEYEKAKAAYKFIHKREKFEAKIKSGKYKGALEDEINIIQKEPKFTGKYKKLEDAYDVAYSEHPKYNGEYEKYKPAYLFLKTPPEFEGDYGDLEQEYKLIQPKPQFNMFNSKYSRFKPIADGSYKMSGTERIGDIVGKLSEGGEKSLFGEYVTAVNEFNKMRHEYEQCLDKLNDNKEKIRKEVRQSATTTDALLKAAEGMTNGNPALSKRISAAQADARNGRKATSDTSGKITILEAVAVVNGIMHRIDDIVLDQEIRWKNLDVSKINTRVPGIIKI